MQFIKNLKIKVMMMTILIIFTLIWGGVSFFSLHALDSLKTDMAAEGTMLHRGQSSNYECEVQYELSFLFNKLAKGE